MPSKPPKPNNITAAPRYKRKKAGSSQGHPWDRPSIPIIGDETPHEVYTAVGWALSGWEMLEMSLVGLFDSFIGIDLDSHASHRAYGAVTIWNIRRDMLRAAAEAYFLEFPNPALSKDIEETINLIDHCASRRNDIAHGIVLAYDEIFGPPSPLGGFRGWLLFPSLTSTKAIRVPFGAPRYAYSANQINIFGQNFRNINPEVERLLNDVRKRESFPLALPLTPPAP
jgi:hypothetical protein